MNLKSKFTKLTTVDKYQRVDATHNIDIYLGYNQNGQKSMVITEYSKIYPVKSSKAINVLLNKREDGKSALSFDLIDDIYENLFYVFCNDIVISSQNISKDKSIAFCLKRWTYWKSMFSKKKDDLLSELEIKGLIGELYFLKNNMIRKYGVDASVKSWMGPLYGHKDFEINNTWYEVKSISEAAITVKVSSIEQLDSDKDGHLIVIRLEKSNVMSQGILRLNEMVQELASMIEDSDVLHEFGKKLNNMGYTYCEEYDEIVYSFKGIESYLINHKFPIMRKKQMHNAITNITYAIILNNINRFKEGVM